MTDHRLARRDLLKVTGAGILAVGASGVAQATDGDDAGTEEATEIEDWHDLDGVREDLDGDYVLVADLDSDTDGYEEHVGDPEGGFEPIGDRDFDKEVEFTGTFDGNGNEIVDLVIARPDESHVGLFGASFGVIENVGVTDATVTGAGFVGGLVGENIGGGKISESHAEGDVTGNDFVGGLVGSNRGDISESHAEGDVTGNDFVGGLVGWNTFAEIASTAAEGDVTGEGFVGGLVGANSDEIVSSFATGAVDGDSAVGGVVGENDDDGTVTNTYWDVEATGQQDGIGDGQGDTTGLDTDEMQGEVAAENMDALDFEETWQTVTDPDDYPVLQWQIETEIEIGDWHDLDAVRDDLDGDYVLVADLDSDTDGYDEHVGDPEEGWEPIADFEDFDDVEFTGTFDGNGNEIADLVCDRPEEDHVGLFGGSEGRIENVTLTDAAVTGANQVGGLVGFNDRFGEIESAIVEADVTGEEAVGSLAGFNFISGEIASSSAAGDVTGDVRVGGLVGSNSGEMASSSAEADVTGDSRVGGLVGGNRGEIESSSAAGDITGNLGVGGLVGSNAGEVRNSHYSIDAVNINGEDIVTIGGLFEEQYQDWEESGQSLDVTDYDSLTESDGRVEISDVQGVRDALGFTQDYDIGWRLVADIDLTEASPDLYLPYLAGEFDGNDYTITVDIDLPAVSGVGAIGYSDDAVRITDLTVEGDVTGSFSVGGLVGRNDGEIASSSSSAAVTGTRAWVGGLVGRSSGEIASSSAAGNVIGDSRVGGLVGRNSSEIASSSAAGNAIGDSRVGGLVGRSRGEIASSFATGSVEGESAVGGVVGESNDDVTDTYWDVEATGQQDGIGDGQGDTTGLDTDEMQGEVAAENMGALDFEETWQTVTDPDDYPVLQWQIETEIEIGDWHDLDAVRDDLDGDYVLVADLDSDTDGYDEHVGDPETGFEPIGGLGSQFTGTFDGHGNEIADLVIDRPDESNVGLFGASDGVIENVGVTDATVTGDDNVGGLVGRNDGEIASAAAEEDVTGDFRVGGLVGSNSRSSSRIESSYAKGNVTGDSEVGGLVGTHNLGKIELSFATGAVDGESAVGGVVGENNDDGTVTDTYWDVEATGQQDGIGDGQGDTTGLDTDEMQGEAAAENMESLDFEETWRTITDPDSYPILLWQELPVANLTLGNVTRTEEVTIFDAVAIQRDSLGLDPGRDTFDERLADVNQNGEVEISDAVLAQRISLGIAEGKELEIDEFDAPDQATPGETITVEATIENTGRVGAVENVDYRFGLVDEVDPVQQSLLDIGGSNTSPDHYRQTVEFEHTIPADTDPGTYSHGVTTEDDTWLVEIEIAE